MSEKIYAVTRIGSDRINVSIGPWDEERHDLRFGWDAELTVETDYWNDGAMKVQVGFASIGSLPVTDAAERARSYTTAAALGLALQNLIENEGYGFGNVADYLSDPAVLITDGVHLEFVYDPREAGA